MFQQQCGQPTLTPAQQNEKNYPKRTKVLKYLFWMSVMLMPFGVCTVVFGTVLLVNREQSIFPFNSGHQIWTGALMFVFGLIGYLTSKTPANLKDGIPVRMKILFGVFYGFAVASLSIGGLGFGYSIGGTVQCLNDNECLHGATVVLVMVAMSIPISAFYLGCAIFGMGLFIRYRFAFQMYNNRERLVCECVLQQHVASLENHVAQLEGNQSTGYTYGETGSYGKTNSGFTGSSPSIPPPPYTKRNKM